MAQKDKVRIQPEINVAAGTVKFNIKGMDPLMLDLSKVHPEIVKRAALVGMAQVRIVDKAAIGMTDDEGNIIEEDERLEMKRSRMAELIEHYHSGTDQWNMAGTGQGSRSITIEAIARIKDVSYDEAKAYVEKFASAKRKMPDGKEMSFGGDTKKALAYLREGKQISEMIAQIRTERLPAAKVDADAALEELK